MAVAPLGSPNAGSLLKQPFQMTFNFPWFPQLNYQKQPFQITSNFPWFPQQNYQPNKMDIGTKILYFQCFVTTDMFLFRKPIILIGNCRICRDLAFGNIKTHFKSIFKKLDLSALIDLSAHIYFFMNFCPRRATKLRSLYNVEVSKYHLIMQKLLVKDNNINKQYTCSSYYGPFMRAINVEVSEV